MRHNALQLVRCNAHGWVACFIQLDGSHRPQDTCTCDSGEGWQCPIDAHACRWLQANPDFGDRFCRRLSQAQETPATETSPEPAVLVKGWIKQKRAYTRRQRPEGIAGPPRTQKSPDTMCAASGLLPLAGSLTL